MSAVPPDFSSCEDPCAKAKKLSEAATDVSKTGAYSTAKTDIQTAAFNDGKEHGIGFGKDAYGNIITSTMSSGGSHDGTIPSVSGAFADLHNHPNNTAPSEGDLYSLLERNSTNSSYNTRIIVTASGAVYALVVYDQGQAATFKSFFPPVNDPTYGPMFPNNLFNEYNEVKDRAKNIGGYDNLTADGMAMAYVLDKYYGGIALLKQGTDGIFRKQNTVETTSAYGEITYVQNNCN